jgi:transposase
MKHELNEFQKEVFVAKWNNGWKSRDLAYVFNLGTVTMVNRIVNRLRKDGYELKRRKTNGKMEEERKWKD